MQGDPRETELFGERCLYHCFDQYQFVSLPVNRFAATQIRAPRLDCSTQGLELARILPHSLLH